MPIKQLDTTAYSMPEAGRVRLGEMVKKRGGKSYPRELPYFALRDAEDVIDAYGPEPTELLVYFPYSDVEENWQVWMERWSGAGCLCRGDGDQIIKLIDPSGKGGETVIRGGAVKTDYTDTMMEQFNRETGEYVPRELPVATGDTATCPGPERNLYPRCTKCQPTGRLFFLLRDPKEPMELLNRRFAYYVLSTRSLRNIKHINGFFNTLKMVAEAMGTYDKLGVSTLPVILRRVKGTVQRGDKKGLMQVDKWFVELEFDNQLQRRAADALAQSAQGLLEPRTASFIKLSHVDEGEFYDEPEIDPATEQIIADLQALQQDAPPPNLAAAIAIMSEIAGTSWNERWFFLRVREYLGLAANAKVTFPGCWDTMIAVMIAIQNGELFFPEENAHE